jgi:hypothetical protein
MKTWESSRKLSGRRFKSDDAFSEMSTYIEGLIEDVYEEEKESVN